MSFFELLMLVCLFFAIFIRVCIGSIFLVDLTKIDRFVATLVLLILLLNTLQLFVDAVFLIR